MPDSWEFVAELRSAFGSDIDEGVTRSKCYEAARRF
jgi:hypothetical protein